MAKVIKCEKCERLRYCNYRNMCKRCCLEVDQRTKIKNMVK